LITSKTGILGKIQDTGKDQEARKDDLIEVQNGLRLPVFDQVLGSKGTLCPRS
jgi:hypothetical protein